MTMMRLRTFALQLSSSSSYPSLRLPDVAGATVCQGELGRSVSARPPPASGCSRQPRETRGKCPLREGNRSFPSHFHLGKTTRGPHSAPSETLFHSEEKRTEDSVGGPRMGSPGSLGASPKLLVKNQKLGCCLPTLRGKQPTNRQMDLCTLRGQADSSDVHPGHTPVPQPPGPQQRDRLHLASLFSILSPVSLPNFLFPHFFTFSFLFSLLPLSVSLSVNHGQHKESRHQDQPISSSAPHTFPSLVHLVHAVGAIQLNFPNSTDSFSSSFINPITQGVIQTCLRALSATWELPGEAEGLGEGRR